MPYLLFLLVFTLSCSPKTFNPPSAEGYRLEIKTLQTRGTQMDYLLARREGVVRFKKVLILFPGGDGTCHFGDHHSLCQKRRNYLNGVWVSNNFLARNILRFARRGDLVVLVDMPRDVKRIFADGNSKLLASAHRVSERHLEDIRNLVFKLKYAFGVEEFYLIGTSRGTLSVAYLTDRIPEVKGSVLTATLSSDPHFAEYCRGGDFLKCTGFEGTDKRVLFLHHRLDGCVSSSYSLTRRVFQKIKSKEKEFITLQEGSEPADNPCSGLTYHGFFGKDREAVERILSWIHSGG
ncbi:hypothetical protein [Hydrogenivirga sp. 128-5-R1-1]|uniref:hypothetical protein n=1 Tax=Hydrogenivirga sp. 128-5-R1-1 TaxID=392423 RepID=UPI0012FB0836|nr:hypothetical protein [Hydrogenivirga sp. 128-5-R1-1]